LAREAHDRLENEADWPLLNAAIVKAAMLGARVGIAEALAQVVEQGHDVNLDMQIRDHTLEELMADDE
jgi:hypothetical protein